MAPFEQLQELWQRQPELPIAQLADVSRLLRAYGRRQRWINSGKAVVVFAILTACFVHSLPSAPRTAGVLLVAIVAGVLLARDWREQTAIGRRDFTAPSTGFVNTTIDRLLAQRNVKRSYYWSLIAAAVVAENLVLTGTQKVWLRFVASALPFGALEFGLWVRRRRFDYECRPLLEQLRAVQASLEEHAE